MNILHINLNYDKSKIHHNIVAEMNKKQGINGRVFFPIPKGSKELYNVEFLDAIRCLRKPERFLYNVRNRHLFKIAYKMYSPDKYDTILAHSLFSNGFLAMTLSKELKLPYSVIVTNTDVNGYFAKLAHLRKRGIEILMNSHRIVFSSIAYQDLLVRKYVPDHMKDKIIEKSVSIPFGIDSFWIENRKERSYRQSGEVIKLLYVGKINKNKNLTLTLDACKQLINSGLDIQYTVVGDASDSEGSLILNELLSRKFVHHIPSVDFSKLIEIYRQNDIFVMPSIAESFGLVYAEALTQGMPIIYTRGQGFDKQFDDNVVGVSVSSGSSNDVAHAVKYIVKHYNRLSKTAYQKSTKFYWPTIADRFILAISN